jgi:hypothetical protein
VTLPKTGLVTPRTFSPLGVNILSIFCTFSKFKIVIYSDVTSGDEHHSIEEFHVL